MKISWINAIRMTHPAKIYIVPVNPIFGINAVITGSVTKLVAEAPTVAQPKTNPFFVGKYLP